MARSGWLTMRNVPKVKARARAISDNEFFSVLLDFFAKHTICPMCGGLGFTGNNQSQTVIPEAVVRFRGIDELEHLSESGAKMTDIIREVLEFQTWKKKRCPACRGLRFVKKDRIAELKKRMKRSGKKKSNKKNQKRK